ncbi:protein of unknown function [Pararobbsia alpina]
MPLAGRPHAGLAQALIQSRADLVSTLFDTASTLCRPCVDLESPVIWRNFPPEHSLTKPPIAAFVVRGTCGLAKTLT